MLPSDSLKYILKYGIVITPRAFLKNETDSYNELSVTKRDDERALVNLIV